MPCIRPDKYFRKGKNLLREIFAVIGPSVYSYNHVKLPGFDEQWAKWHGLVVRTTIDEREPCRISVLEARRVNALKWLHNIQHGLSERRCPLNLRLANSRHLQPAFPPDPAASQLDAVVHWLQVVRILQENCWLCRVWSVHHLSCILIKSMK